MNGVKTTSLRKRAKEFGKTFYRKWPDWSGLVWEELGHYVDGLEKRRWLSCVGVGSHLTVVDRRRLLPGLSEVIDEHQHWRGIRLSGPGRFRVHNPAQHAGHRPNQPGRAKDRGSSQLTGAEDHARREHNIVSTAAMRRRKKRKKRADMTEFLGSFICAAVDFNRALVPHSRAGSREIF